MRLSSTLVTLTLAGLGLAPTLSALEEFYDLRVNLELLPGLTEANYNLGHTPTTLSTATSTGITPVLVYRQLADIDNPWGWLMGVGYFIREQSGTFGSANYNYDSTGVEVMAGAVYRVTPEFHFECAPNYCYGSGKLDKVPPTQPPAGANQTVNKEKYKAWGLSAGAFYTFTTNIQLGVSLGYLDGKGKSTYRVPISANNVTVSFAGLYANASVGFIF
jgi:hypothetical protein